MTEEGLLIIGEGPVGRAARDEAAALGLTSVTAASDALVMVEADNTVVCQEGDRLVVHRPACLLLAPEPEPRRLPIPGWTLPGVTSLAEAAPLPGDVLWIAAARALLAGAQAVFPAARFLALDEVSDVAADGTERLTAIRFRDAQGLHCLPADRLVLHDGVVPAVQQTAALGCDHAWDARRRCWYPVIDAAGATSRAGVFSAGDSEGSARRAAQGVARALGCSVPPAAPVAVMDVVPPLRVLPADATIVCPCEEVAAGAVREAARLGCLGLNQLKAYTRCGMGVCQGRRCGAIAAEVLADARGVDVATVAPMRVRFPLVPVTLGALAALCG